MTLSSEVADDPPCATHCVKGSVSHTNVQQLAQRALVVLCFGDCAKVGVSYTIIHSKRMSLLPDHVWMTVCQLVYLTPVYNDLISVAWLGCDVGITPKMV